MTARTRAFATGAPVLPSVTRPVTDPVRTRVRSISRFAPLAIPNVAADPAGLERNADFLLRALVTKPVAEISEMANKVSMGQLDAPEYVRNSRDEIGSLSASFNRMRRSLQNAMSMLEEQS